MLKRFGKVRIADPAGKSGSAQRKRAASDADMQPVDAVHVSASGTRKRRQGSSVKTKGLTRGESSSTQERIKGVLIDQMTSTNTSSRRAYNRPRSSGRVQQSAGKPKQAAGKKGGGGGKKPGDAPMDALSRRIFTFVDEHSREQIALDDAPEPEDGLEGEASIRTAAYRAVFEGLPDAKGKAVLDTVGLKPGAEPVVARDDEHDLDDPRILARNPQTVMEAEALRLHAASVRSGESRTRIPDPRPAPREADFEIPAFREDTSSWSECYRILKQNAERAVQQLDESDGDEEGGMEDDPAPAPAQTARRRVRKKKLPRGARGKALENVPEHDGIDPAVLLENDVLLEAIQGEMPYWEKLCSESQRRMMAQHANRNVAAYARAAGKPVPAPAPLSNDAHVQLRVPSEREQYEGVGFAPYEMSEPHLARLLRCRYGNFTECLSGAECVATQWWPELNAPLMGAVSPEDFEAQLGALPGAAPYSRTLCVVCEAHLVLRTALLQSMREGACVTVQPSFYFPVNSPRGGYTADGGLMKRQTMHDENPAAARVDRPGASYENCGGMTTAFRVFQRTSFSVTKHKVRYRLRDGAWAHGEVMGLVEDNPPVFTEFDAIKPPTRYLRPLCFVSRRPAVREDGEYDTFKVLRFEFMLHQDAYGTISDPEFAEMANMAFVPGRGSESRAMPGGAFSNGNTTLAIMFPSNKTSTSRNSVLHLRRKQQTRKRAPPSAAKVRRLRDEQLKRLGAENIRDDDFLATFDRPEQQDIEYVKAGPVSVEYWMRAVSKETFEAFSSRCSGASMPREEQLRILINLKTQNGEHMARNFMGADRIPMPFDAIFQADLRVTAARLPEVLMGMRLWLTHVRSCRLFNYTVDLEAPLAAFALQLDPELAAEKAGAEYVTKENALLGRFFAPRRLYLAYIVRQTIAETLLTWFHRPTKPNNPRIYKRLKVLQDWDMEYYYHIFREQLAGATAGTQWLLNPAAPLDADIPGAYFDDHVLRQPVPNVPLATDQPYTHIEAVAQQREVPRERLSVYYAECFARRKDSVPQLVRAAFADEFDAVRYAVERGRFVTAHHMGEIWDLVVGRKIALRELDPGVRSTYQSTTVPAEQAAGEEGEDAALRGPLFSCLTQTVRVGAAAVGAEAQREAEWADAARAIAELDPAAFTHAEFCASYSVIWLLMARMFAVEWLVQYERPRLEEAERSLMLLEQRYLFAVSKHSDLPGKAREAARDNWRGAERELRAIRRRMHDLYTYAYSHYKLLLRTMDGGLLANADFYEFVPSVCRKLVDESGDPLPAPLPRECSFLTHYEECQPHDALSLHEGMLPDMGTLVLNIEFILPPLVAQSDSQVRASGGFMGVTGLVLEQVSRLHSIARKLLPRLCQVRDSSEIHSMYAPQNMAYLHMTRIAFQLTMLGGFEHSEHRLPLLKGLHIFADTALGVHGGAEAMARLREEQSSCSVLYTLCLTNVLVFYIEQIPTYEQFILLNYPAYAHYKHSVRHKTRMARQMYAGGVPRQQISQFLKDKDLFKNKSLAQHAAAQRAFADGFEEQHARLAERLRASGPRYAALAAALTSQAALAARTRRATQPLKEHIYRPSIDNVVRTLRGIVDNMDLKRSVNGYRHARLPDLAARAIRARVHALRPNEEIVLVVFLLDLNRFVARDSPSLLFHPASSLLVWWALDMLAAAENMDVIERGLNLMPPLCWAVFSYVVRALHAHYSVSVLLLPDHIARKQMAAVRRRTQLMRPDPRATAISISTCCNRLVSFHAAQNEASAHNYYGQSTSGFVPMNGGIVCSNRPGASRSSSRATASKEAGARSIARIEAAARAWDVGLLRDTLRDLTQPAPGQPAPARLCGSVPIASWPTVGHVILSTEARGRVVAYSCCTLCGSNMGFSVTNYGEWGLICGSCTRDDLARQQTPSCAACGQIMRGDMTLALALGLFDEPGAPAPPAQEKKLKLWRQFWVFHDTPANPYYTFRRAFVCHACASIKPSGATRLPCFEYPEVISYASDIPRIRRGETWLDLEVRTGKLDVYKAIRDFYVERRLASQ